MPRIKPATDVRTLTAADIATMVATNKATEADALRTRQDAARALAEQRAERHSLVLARRAELAADLGVTPSGLEAKLVAIAPNRHGPTADRTIGPVWRALLLLTGTPDDADPATADESRHVLAATGALPKVRKGSVFGDAAKLRDLPALELMPPRIYESWIEDVLARDLGIPWPVRAPNALEPPRGAWERTRAQRDRHEYDVDGQRNQALADREFELVADAYRTEQRRADAEYRSETLAVRQRVIATVDAALALAPIGIPWAWTRELRRHVAAERPRLETEFARVWSTCQALGVRLGDGGAR